MVILIPASLFDQMRLWDFSSGSGAKKAPLFALAQNDRKVLRIALTSCPLST
jgi:hypothetical protein